MTTRYDVPKLPESSVLDLEDYLAVQRAIGEESRYRILAELLREGERSATELVDTLDIKSNSLHYHLDELVDVGLVANRKRKERGADGLYSCYVATSLGKAVMKHGIGELIREESDILTRYSYSFLPHPKTHRPWQPNRTCSLTRAT
jgi:ArsR family transcriptional regulator, arsenate/arsenite/antimonite-responsive transcriptional repressor